jgi:hypothetical protein
VQGLRRRVCVLRFRLSDTRQRFRVLGFTFAVWGVRYFEGS